jgi:uncharacterized protein with HEPN domain
MSGRRRNVTRSMPSDAKTAAALADIHEHIVLARRWTDSLNFQAFAEDRLVFYAVTRCLEIISEASRRIGDDIRSRYPDVPWMAIRDAGNVYRHQYDDVLERRIFDTVRNSLDTLERAVTIELAN